VALLSEKIALFQIFLKKNYKVEYSLIGAERINTIAAGSAPFA
jgi:hypothetical protein